MEVYSVYPGIDVTYTAFLSVEATFHHAASPDILELFYCHSGRVGWNMREGTAVYLGAVSYTHLDVYKRQARVSSIMVRGLFSHKSSMIFHSASVRGT